MEKKFVSDLKANERFSSYFILTRKDLRLTKEDKPFLAMTLSDKSGRMEARLWDDAEKTNKLVETGDVVLVKGLVETYKDERQIRVETIERAPDGSFEYGNLVRVLENREKYLEKVIKYLKDIKNKHVARAADLFLEDADFMSRFASGIGAKSWHNAYVGGLLEHTYEVMFIADRMTELYPEADRDILIFGSFLHDLGKVYELDEKNLEYTVEGGLIGHITIGYSLLMKKLGGIKDFPYDLKLELGHVILSHHGEYEQQSPILPKTLEAVIVYQADELVSQANAIKEIKMSQSGGGRTWSDFVPMKNRRYYVKNDKNH